MVDRSFGSGRLQLKEMAVARIKHAILTGEFQPGERLNDAKLQTWLGISRTPLREALGELTRVGLIETEPQRYTRVATPNSAHIDDHIQVLGTLLGGIVRITVPSLDDAGRDKAVALVEDVISASTDRSTSALFEAGTALTRFLVEGCPNPVIANFARDIIDATTFLLKISNVADQIDWDRAVALHKRLQSCVSERDAIGAELAIEEFYRLPV